MPGIDVSQTVKLLALVGSIHPESWDAVKPQWSSGRGHLDWVLLNPQPLPPQPPDRFVLAAVRMSNRLVTVAVEDAARNGGTSEWLAEVVDDWCGTPWPRKWPWPGPGPMPGREDGPHPEPWSLATAKVSGAVVLASLAVRLGEGELREVLVRGAEKLAEAAANEI